MPGLSNSVDRFNGVLASLAVKVPCVVAAEVPITLSGEQTVNGVAVVSGDRVLVTAQASSVDNGIYDASASTWARAADFDGNRDVTTDTFVISARSAGSPVFWHCTSAEPIVIGSSAITFVILLDPDAATVSDLQEVTDEGNTTDNDVDLTTGAALLIRNTANDELTTISLNNVLTFDGENQISGFSFVNYSGDFTIQDGRARMWGVSGTGHGLYVNSTLGNDQVTLTNDGLHLIFDNSTGLGSITGLRLTDDLSIYIGEKAAANADVTGAGQLWVDSGDELLKYTTENGVEYNLTDTGAPNGASTEIQYNTGGAFDSDSGFYWTAGSHRLSISDDATGTLHISVGSDVATIDALNLERIDFDTASIRVTEANAALTLAEGSGSVGAVTGHGSYMADSATWTGVWPAYIDEVGEKWNLMDFDLHQFQFSQLTSAADPTTGFMRWDNATPGSVTNLYIDDLDHTGKANHKWLSHLADGDFIRMTDGITDSTVWYGTVNGTPTDNTGWWTIPVATLFGNTRPLSSNPVQLEIQWFGQMGSSSQVITATWRTASGGAQNYESGATSGFESGSVQTFEDGAIFEIEESATMADPTAGHMRWWTRNDAPNVPMVTNDLGDDYQLSTNIGTSVGLTAHVGSSQGDGVITATYNVYSTVANVGDAATLPATSVVGDKIYIKNDGANSMDVFPASGDDAGAGTDTAVAIANGVGAMFMATVADATWTQMY